MPRRAEVVSFIQHAIDWLKSSSAEKSGEDWVSLWSAFYRHYHAEIIFSTRISGEFPEELLRRVALNKPVVPEDPRVPLGEYDKQFNQWLASLK